MLDQLKTRDGEALVVRPIESQDRSGLRDAFAHLSQESRYKRFLAPIRSLTESELDYLTQVDHRDHEALVALNADGEIVGVARYIRLPDDPTVAEVAVTVVDEWQGRGVGTGLLRRLAQRASETATGRFLAVCLAGNRDMLELLHELGPVVAEHSLGDDVVEVEVDLPAEPEAPELRAALRTAARGSPRPSSPPR